MTNRGAFESKFAGKLEFTKDSTGEYKSSVANFVWQGWQAGAAAERKACEAAARSISDKYAFGYYGNEVDTADEIADKIRDRSAS